MDEITYVDLDVHKSSIAVSLAEGHRGGDVRYLGPIPNNPAAVRDPAARLSQGGKRLGFCYGAGPCACGV